MRKRFEIQLELGATPIEEIEIPDRCRPGIDVYFTDPDHRFFNIHVFRNTNTDGFRHPGRHCHFYSAARRSVHRAGIVIVT